MYFEAIKWVLGMTDGSTASHAKVALLSAIRASLKVDFRISQQVAVREPGN
jgi:hypothetical protein